MTVPTIFWRTFCRSRYWHLGISLSCQLSPQSQTVNDVYAFYAKACHACSGKCYLCYYPRVLCTGLAYFWIHTVHGLIIDIEISPFISILIKDQLVEASCSRMLTGKLADIDWDWTRYHFVNRTTIAICFPFFSLLTYWWTGKCSHGGAVDQTSTIEPKGGINKDTESASHGHLHQDAARLATDATAQLLDDVGLAAGDTDFLRYRNPQ